jgi:putative transposase
MPWSLKRYQQAGDLHFLTFSCYRRKGLLGTSFARNTFVEALEAMRIRASVDIHGYVVMPEHVHLLLGEPENRLLSNAVQGLKQAVSYRLGTQVSPFWEARYYDFNVFSDKKRIEKLKYIHRNPVTRGLVERPDDWEWSSFRQYSTGESGMVKVTLPWKHSPVTSS